MSDKTKRALAITALVFMAIFTVSFVIFLASPGLWNGAVAFIALFSGVIGIGLFLFIKFYESAKSSQNPKVDSDTGDGDEPENESEVSENTESENAESEPENEAAEPEKEVSEPQGD